MIRYAVVVTDALSGNTSYCSFENDVLKLLDENLRHHGINPEEINWERSVTVDSPKGNVTATIGTIPGLFKLITLITWQSKS